MRRLHVHRMPTLGSILDFLTSFFFPAFGFCLRYTDNSSYTIHFLKVFNDTALNLTDEAFFVRIRLSE